MLVLVGVAVVVLELHLAVDAVPAAAVERLAQLLAVAVALARLLAQDHHRRVGGRGVVGGRLPELLLVALAEFLGARPVHLLRPLRGGEDLFEISFSAANCTVESPPRRRRNACGESPISRDCRMSRMASATYDTRNTTSGFVPRSLTSVER